MASITNLVATHFACLSFFMHIQFFWNFLSANMHFFVWLFALFVKGKTNLFEFGTLLNFCYNLVLNWYASEILFLK